MSIGQLANTICMNTSVLGAVEIERPRRYGLCPHGDMHAPANQKHGKIEWILKKMHKKVDL